MAEAGCCAGEEGWIVAGPEECVEAGQENLEALGVAEEEWTEEDSEEEAAEDLRWTVEQGGGWDREKWI